MEPVCNVHGALAPSAGKSTNRQAEEGCAGRVCTVWGRRGSGTLWTVRGGRGSGAPRGIQGRRGSGVLWGVRGRRDLHPQGLVPRHLALRLPAAHPPTTRAPAPVTGLPHTCARSPVQNRNLEADTGHAGSAGVDDCGCGSRWRFPRGQGPKGGG